MKEGSKEIRKVLSEPNLEEDMKPKEVIIIPSEIVLDSNKSAFLRPQSTPRPSKEEDDGIEKNFKFDLNKNLDPINPPFKTHRSRSMSRRASEAFTHLRKESTIIVISCWTSFRGVLLAMLSALFFSITAVIVKFLTGVDPALMAAFRFVGITLFSFASISELNTESVFGPRNCRIWVVLRGIVGASSLYLRYCSLHLLPLANATVISLSIPVFVCIFARIFLNEAFGIFHVISLAVTLVGIGFTAEFGVIIGLTDESDSGLDRETQLYGLACGLATAIIGSLSYIIVRKVKHLHNSTILFNFAWVASVETLIITYFMDGFHLPSCGIAPWLMILISILSFYAQMLLTRALQIEEAGIVSVSRASSELVLAFLFQILLFNRIPDACTIIGSVLVFTAVVLTSLRKYILTLPGDHCMRRWFKFTLM